MAIDIEMNNNNETIYKSQEVFYRKYNYNTETENNYNFFDLKYH